MRIEQIHIDLDDVLNRCTMAALSHVGCPVDIYDESTFDPEWGWDIVRAANVLHPSRKFTKESFWMHMDSRFWTNIPKSSECDELIDKCAKAVGRENVCILTTPISDPYCLAGKLEWIHKFTPPWMHRQYMMGVKKELCAKPGSLLIDDRDLNVDRFREAGGSAILMPRPWNTKWHECLNSFITFHRAFNKEIRKQ